MSTSWRKTKTSEKARRVAFYRNGDYFDGGVRLAFRGNKPFSTMPHLLDYLSQKTRMPAKKLFSLPEGKPIKSIDELEDGKSYVISSDSKFEPLPYGSVPRIQTSHIAAALPTRQEDIQLLRPVQGNANDTSKKKKKIDQETIERLYAGRREGRLLNVKAKDTRAHATVLFNDRNPLSFEEVLKDFGNALGLRKVERMSTLNGREVRSISQLKNEFQDVDTFILSEETSPSYQDVRKSDYSTVVSRNTRTAAKSEARHETTRTKHRVGEFQNFPRAQWIHGYDGGTLLLLENGELVYPVAATVVLYSKDTDTQRHYLGHNEDISSICIHPSGRMMASGQVSSSNEHNAVVHVWMVDSLQTVSSITRLTGSPISMAFSSHNFVLMTVEAGADQDCLSFWDWEGDALLGRVQMQNERLTGGTFHPKEPELAVTFGVHHLAFWRRRSDGFLGRVDALAPGHSGRTILCWTFVGDSSLVVGDSSGYVTLWALLPGDSFRITKEVRAHNNEVRCLLAMREGTLISGGGDQLKAWDTHQRLLPLAITDLPEGEVKNLSLQGPNDISLYVGTTQSILDGSLQSSFKTLIQGIEVQTLDLAVDSEGTSFVSVDQFHNIYRWAVRYLMWKTKSLVDLCCVGFHPDGKAITAGGSNGKLLVMHADGGLVVATISVADVGLKTLAYDPGGSVLAIGCEDGNIYVCEARNQGYLYKMQKVLKNDWPILQIDWSSDGEWLQSAYRKNDFCEVTLWRVSDSKILKSAHAKNKDWPEHTCNLSHNVIGIWKRIKDVFYLSCHRKGSKLATGAQDGYIRIFPYPYGENDKGDPEEWRQSSQAVNLVRFLKKNTLVATSGSAIFIWNLKR